MAELGPCRYCGLPVLDTQLRYTAGEYSDPPRYAHGDCKTAEDARYKSSLKRIGALSEDMADTVAALRRRLGL